MRVLITGASSGIGKSFALEYAKFGYDLVLVARDMEKLKSVKREITNDVSIDICSLDLSDINNCYKLYDKYKDIDIVINNAGFGDFGEFINTDINRDMEMIDTNVKAMHVILKLYLSDMVKRNSGSILTVASVAGFMPGPLMSTYYASKNYVVRLNEAIREELRRNNSKVVVSILCPGPVRTNFDNVANVRFSLNGMSSDDVCRYAINKFSKGKFYIVPGLHIRMLRFVSKIIPSKLMAKMVYNSQKRKDNV